MQASASTESAAVGDRVTYTATVTNTGETAAAGAVVVGTLSDGLTHVSARIGDAPCNGVRPIICDAGRLEAGASVTVTLLAEAREPGAHTLAVYAASESFDRADDEPLATVQTDIRP
ncbi:MAG: DUF11 domain-containing protein [Chloroflexi bacterium]|nr:DUF11 domain-containing protein [Chloroflexota bacterium]